MRIWRRPRRAALVGFVDSLEHVMDTPGTAAERMVPTGDVSLVVTLHSDGFSYDAVDGPHHADAACLAGPQRRAQVVETAPQRGMVAVNFTAGGAAPFLAVPLDAVADAYPSLGELWGVDGDLLREGLVGRPPQEMLDVLEDLLLAHLQRPLRRDLALDLALRELDRGARVDVVVGRFGTTAKPFVRRVRAATGMTPKTYARLRRLQRVLAALPEAGPVDWAAVAAEHGFSDQAHLVHDFSAITGVTPSRYRPVSAGARNHLPADLLFSPSPPSAGAGS